MYSPDSILLQKTTEPLREDKLKYAVSNIAWNIDERLDAYNRLSMSGIKGLEIAPGVLFSRSNDAFLPSDKERLDILAELDSFGLKIVSMQSLLFGVEGAELFGKPHAQKQFIRGMRRAIALAGSLSIPHLVFGSPKQRIIPGDQSHSQAMKHAIDVLGSLGDDAFSKGVRIGIENNPAIYGGNFLLGVDDVAHFVETVRHPAICMTLDLGGASVDDDIEELCKKLPSYIDKIGHVHISEPYLAPAPASPTKLSYILKALSKLEYSHWISIEMKRAPLASMRNLEAALQGLNDARSLITRDMKRS